jgi:hypothetical protein
MEELRQALLDLDELYHSLTIAEYEQERAKVERRVQELLPGFTVAYAVEIGSVGSGEEGYTHGGVAHVLMPVRKKVASSLSL